MAYEIKENSGSLFKNERREKDTHAHARGSALIDGVEYWLDAWTNEDRNGNKYQSLKFKRKDGQSGGGQRTPDGSQGSPPDNGGSNYDDLDDDIPF